MRLVNFLVLVGLGLSVPVTVVAERVVTALQLEASLAPADESGKEGSIKISSTDPKLSSFLIGKIEKPSLTTTKFALRGSVSYQDAKEGYLELLAGYSPNENYFSKGLAESGPMGKIAGSSAWRTFEIPFQASAGHFPESISLNLHLSGGGTVWVKDVQLVELSAEEIAKLFSKPYDGVEYSIGFIGAFIGLLGAIVGILAGRRANPKLIWKLEMLAVAFGIALIVFSGYLYSIGNNSGGKSFAYLGALTIVIFGANMIVARRIQIANELRSMSAKDMR